MLGVSLDLCPFLFCETGSLDEPGYHFILQAGWLTTPPLALKFVPGFYMDAGIWTQVLTLAQQAFYPLSHLSSLFLFLEGNYVSTQGKDEYAKTCYLLSAVFETRPWYVAQARSPASAKITGMHHWHAGYFLVIRWCLEEWVVLPAEWEGGKMKKGL